MRLLVHISSEPCNGPDEDSRHIGRYVRGTLQLIYQLSHLYTCNSKKNINIIIYLIYFCNTQIRLIFLSLL